MFKVKVGFQAINTRNFYSRIVMLPHTSFFGLMCYLFHPALATGLAVASVNRGAAYIGITISSPAGEPSVPGITIIHRFCGVVINCATIAAWSAKIGKVI